MGFLGRIKDGIKKFNFWIVVVVAFGVYITFFSDYNYFRSMEYDARIKDLKARSRDAGAHCQRGISDEARKRRLVYCERIKTNISKK